MAEFKDMLKYYRMRDNLSQSELAKKIHVTPATIGNYETGIRKPRPQHEEALADVFNVSIDNLRGIDTERAYSIPKLDSKMEYIISHFPLLEENEKDIILNTISAFLNKSE